MNVYLSARSDDLPAAQAAMKKIQAAGHKIVHDWTEELHLEATASAEWLSKRAKSDLDGVARADVVVVLLPLDPRLGVPIEMGAALVLGIPVFVVEEENVFVHFFSNHPCVHSFVDLESAIREIGTVEDQPEHLGMLALLRLNCVATTDDLRDVLKLYRALQGENINSLEDLQDALTGPRTEDLAQAVRDFLNGPLSQHAAVFRAHYQALQRALERL